MTKIYIFKPDGIFSIVHSENPLEYLNSLDPDWTWIPEIEGIERNLLYTANDGKNFWIRIKNDQNN